ncbi:hypothetical protein AB0L40_26260 [Patulibacter sp. NPDC049589]|uniref:hypothetical protein n=1 Tax=Patulibacter sp. NPDC049589 TaxID=3154731 RepID=UPI0034246091
MLQSPSGRRAARALTAVSCAAFLAACGGDGGAGPPAASTSAGGDRPAGASSSAGRDRSGAWPGRTDDRDVIARRRVALRTPEDAPADVRPTADLLVRGLTVRGRLATLRFTAVVHGWTWDAPRFEGGRAPYAPTLYEIDPGRNTDVVDAHLIDPVHLRRHAPLEDSEGEVLASMTWAGGADGLPIDASWMFAAPPEGVDAVDVQVGSWPVFREVPVTRR